MTLHRIRRTAVTVGLLASLLSTTAAQADQSSPGSSAPADVDPALALIRLMNMPPVGIMETCRPGDPTVDGQLAVALCSFRDDIVVYASFEDPASLAAAYADIAATSGVTGGTSCLEGAFEGPYVAADGAPAGRVVCEDSTDGPLLGWSDDENLVLGLIVLPVGSGFAELHDHWLQVRLDAPSPDGGSPSPSGATVGPGQAGAEISQWAAEATASTQYGSGSWSASQAIGGPDADAYGSCLTCWAPAQDPGEPEWLELTYATAVVPTATHIYEANGAGFVVQVEALDEATGAWVTLWQGTDPTPEELFVFSPPLTDTDISTRRIRVTAGPGGAGYPYIDAVQLVGVIPEP